MRALRVTPGQPDSACLEDIANPAGDAEGIVVRSLSVGVCGTDAEIMNGHHGRAPRGHSRLLMGHECVARVERAQADFMPGEFAVPIVRRGADLRELIAASGGA